MLIEVQEPYRTPNKLDQKKSLYHRTIETPSIQNWGRILKGSKKTGKLINEGRSIRFAPNLVIKIQGRGCGQVCWRMWDHRCQQNFQLP